MECTSPAIDTALGCSKTAALLQVDVVEITEERSDMDVTEINVDRNPDVSHEFDDSESSLVPDRSQKLDQDPEINKGPKVETRIIDEDRASEGTESSKADENLDARAECLVEVEGSGFATETVEDVETVRVPRKKSEWLAAWLIEAAEWEGGSWCKQLEFYGMLSLRRGISEEEISSAFSRRGHKFDPSSWRQLRERFLSAKLRKQLGG